MLSSLILAAAIVGQAPVDHSKPRSVPPGIQKSRDRKAALSRNARYREAVAAEAQRRYAEAARRQYEKMLPYMMEQQRQMLQYQADASRNAALHRMAGAMQSQAETYKWEVWKSR